MKFKKAGKLGVFALSIMSGSIAMAADNGWYVGANIGQSMATIDEPRITEFLSSRGYSSVITEDDRSFAGKIYSGYQFNPNFAIEGGYFNLGKFGYNAATVPQGTLDGRIKVQGLNLDLVGILPITSKFSASGRIGVIHSQSRDNFTGTGSVNVINPNPRANDTNFKVGLGLNYAVSDNLSLSGQVERYRINDAVGNRGDVDMVSVGLVYSFGAKPSKVVYKEPERAAAPVYIPQPVLQPVPQVIVVTESKPIMHVKLSADSLFDFNKSTIKPEGRAELEQLGAKLKGVDYTRISVVGHTDRIGSVQYNQNLSEVRAIAVKNYLVENVNINSNMINASGVGEDQATMNDECVGTKTTPKLISCLQPDRRVDIEVVGTQK